MHFQMGHRKEFSRCTSGPEARHPCPSFNTHLCALVYYISSNSIISYLLRHLQRKMNPSLVTVRQETGLEDPAPLFSPTMSVGLSEDEEEYFSQLHNTTPLQTPSPQTLFPTSSEHDQLT